MTVKTKAEIHKEAKKQRTDFDILKFNSKIQEKGIEIYWDKMVICPCRKDVTSQPVSDCINCYGIGFYWYDRQTIKALISGASLSKNFIQWSEVLEGSIYISVDPIYRLGWHDKIVAKDGDSVFSEVLPLEVASDKTIKLHYEPIEILKAVKFVSPSVSLYEINIVNNIDISGKTLTFVDENLIVGNRISVLYKYNPTYLVIDMLNDFRNMYVKERLPMEELQKAPIRVLAKKMHLVT